MVHTKIHVYDSYPEGKYQPGDGVPVGEYQTSRLTRLTLTLEVPSEMPLQTFSELLADIEYVSNKMLDTIERYGTAKLVVPQIESSD